ncbi:hypothetical protein M0813_29860 [Anaeramoeba flamelloides]|uniref:Uncharacterized protein n=1 Tax=Anaeramoeba flamelloides TaxID=1746091 RepID=A0ABQ8XP97_9EUKA|nr:hypothetical protein M0813_29860 [Anaeramoeba flamelloides]
MNKWTKGRGGCLCGNIRIRIQSIELFNDFAKTPNYLRSRFKEPCFVSCKNGGHFVKEANTKKSCYFDHPRPKKFDGNDEVCGRQRIYRTRTKKKRRRRRQRGRKHKEKTKNKNKIKIKIKKQFGFNNILHSFLDNTKVKDLPQEFNKSEMEELNNYSYFADPFFQFKKEDEQSEREENENVEDSEEEEKRNKKDLPGNDRENKRFSEIFQKVSKFEQNNSQLFDEEDQFCSDDQLEKWKKFQQENKSIPIPIFNSASKDLPISDSSIEIKAKGGESLFVQPHKFLESLQTTTERSIENAFNVPLKRVPTWKIQNNCLNMLCNLNFEK